MRDLIKLALGLLVAYLIYRLLSEFLRPIRVCLPESVPYPPPLEPRLTPAPPTEPAPKPAHVNPNTAGPDALTTLPGIGPALAERIITHREQNGPFARLDDLSRVRGIGSSLVERLRPWITLD